MAQSWTFSLKDNVSAAADKMANRIEKVRGGLVRLRAEEEKRAKVREAVKDELGQFSSDKAREKALKRVTKELEKQERLATKIAAKEQRSAARISAKNLAAGNARAAASKSSSMNMLGAGAAGLAAGGAMALYAAFDGMARISWDLGQQIGQAQEFKNSTLMAFETILKSKEAANDAFVKAQRMAIKTGTDYRQMISGYNDLLAQGFDAKFTDDLMGRLADLAVMNPKASMDGIARAIRQVAATGVLQGDELNQLAENGLNTAAVIKQIGKELNLVEGKKNKKGVAQSIEEQVKDLKEGGNIKSDVAIRAIMKTLENQSGGKAPGQLAMEKADKSLTGALMRAESMKQMMLESVAIDWTPITSALTRIQTVMASPVGEKFIQALGDGFNRMLGVLDNISEADIAAAITAAGDAFTTFSKIVANTANFLLACGRAFSAVNEWFKDVSDGATNAFDVIWIAVKGVFTAMTGGLFGLVEIVYDNWNAIGSFFSGIGAVISGAASWIWGALSGLGGMIAGAAAGIWDTVTSIGTGIIDGIISGIDSGAAGIVDSLVNACESAIKAAKDALGIKSPSKRSEKEIGLNIPAGAVRGVDKGAPMLAKATYKMADGAMAAGQNLGRASAANSNAAPVTKNVENHFTFHGSDQENQRATAEAFQSMALSAA